MLNIKENDLEKQDATLTAESFCIRKMILSSVQKKSFEN